MAEWSKERDFWFLIDDMIGGGCVFWGFWFLWDGNLLFERNKCRFLIGYYTFESITYLPSIIIKIRNPPPSPQNQVNAEATFDFMDRYGKGYIADTDVWQTLHAEVPVSFSQICQLFRDLKSPGGGQTKRSQGQMNLAELTQFVFPMQSEEYQHVNVDQNDNETRNVLYVVRSTVTCPGCACRVQRTFEGCSSVTCPVCHTPFR